MQSLYHTFQRFASLQTHKISTLPILILMPHSACNCRCVMCDIWKDNQNLRQLTEKDVAQLMFALKKFGTKQVLMSGGEALLNPNFFLFCKMLKKQNIKISLLSTGLTIKRYASEIVEWVDDVIISLDGDEVLHDSIRSIKGAYKKICEGVQAIKLINLDYRITARSVIHKMNYKAWPAIIEGAKMMGLDQISFLPADVSSHAFNREVLWNDARQNEIALQNEDLPVLQEIIDFLFQNYAADFESGFIAESPKKIQQIYEYYAALHGICSFPFKKCNAPWVSTVVEADGTVRPCFFHEAFGNIHENSLDGILNSEKAVAFRKALDIKTNSICAKCVCHLNLPITANIAG